MSALEIKIDPTEAGFSAERLDRIDRHFQGYVDQKKLAGWHIAISRRGQLVHSSTAGHRDIAAELAYTDDTVVRMFSMTKPITSVAAMMLYEEGLLELKSPISKWLPEFADTRVYRSGSFLAPITDPLTEPIRVWHLLTHTSGLTYGFHNTHATDAIYRRGGFEWGNPPGADLAACCAMWAAMPLAFQPGTEWNYGVSTDVLGRLVEVVSGMPLDDFFRTRIFEPLGMTDTDFYVHDELLDRFATLRPQPEDR